MLTDCDFTTRVLDCMFFTSFVSERGPPWRPCDYWDELYSNMQEILKSEMLDGRLIFQHIQVIEGFLFFSFLRIYLSLVSFRKNFVLR